MRPIAKTLLLSWEEQITVTDSLTASLMDQFRFHGVQPESFRVSQCADGLTVKYTVRGEWRESVTVTKSGQHDYGFAMVRALNSSHVFSRDGINYDSIRFSVEGETDGVTISIPQTCPQCKSAAVIEHTEWVDSMIYECGSCKYRFTGRS